MYVCRKAGLRKKLVEGTFGMLYRQKQQEQVSGRKEQVHILQLRKQLLINAVTRTITTLLL